MSLINRSTWSTTKQKMKKEKLESHSDQIIDEMNKGAKRSTGGLTFEVQTEDLEKWNFQERPLFFGQYKRTEHFKYDEVQTDRSITEKEFDLYVFEEFETGQRYHIDSCHTIQKYFENEKTQQVNFTKNVYAIQFLGKKIVKERPLNTFTISKASVS